VALITVNGVNIPTPSNYDVSVLDISNAQRNAQGLMIIERIATKRTISLSYNFLSASDLSTILQAISSTFYNVTFLDPVTNSQVTSSFYAGDRAISMIDYVSGVPRYQNVKFELIER
jgi:hypothetical protein